MSEKHSEDAQTLEERLNAIEAGSGMEPLTPEEKEAFLSRVRAQGRSLTSDEQYAIFGPPPEEKPATETIPVESVEPMDAAELDAVRLHNLQTNFFPELGDVDALPPLSLVRGIVFDFDATLATTTRPLSELMEEGAKNAERYMRSTGMDDLPDEFWEKIIDARQFAAEKSDEEQEEHIADDAMSFLLQFFGYPASKMDPQVLRTAVDIFYAPEMTAWQLLPDARATLEELRDARFRLGLVAHYSCDRVFQRIVDYLQIRPYFDICLCSASVEYRKPDTRIYDIVLERWDVMPYEVVIVGDSLSHDIRAGTELGAMTIQTRLGVSTPQTEYENELVTDQIRPDARIDDLTHLPALVRKWAEA